MPSIGASPFQHGAAVYDSMGRTSGACSRALPPHLVDPNWQEVFKSQFLENSRDFDKMIRDVNSLTSLSDDWNSYGSPAPSVEAIKQAVSMLHSLRLGMAKPEKVSPSADGGVAIVFVGSGKKRAVMESLGKEESYVLLYDTDGHSYSIDWQEGLDSQSKVIGLLEAHLRGEDIAPLG